METPDPFFVVFVLFSSLSWKDEPLHADSDIEMSQGLPPGFMQEIPNTDLCANMSKVTQELKLTIHVCCCFI